MSKAIRKKSVASSSKAEKSRGHRVEQSLRDDPLEKLEEEIRKESTPKNKSSSSIISLFDF